MFHPETRCRWQHGCGLSGSGEVHRTYSGSELKGIIESVCTENDTVGLKILKGIEKYAVVLRDTAQVKEYIEKIAAFEKAVECDYFLIGDGYSLYVYDSEPLIAETVIMAAEPVDMKDDQLADAVCSKADWWGMDMHDLPTFVETVKKYIAIIESEGMHAAIEAAAK